MGVNFANFLNNHSRADEIEQMKNYLKMKDEKKPVWFHGSRILEFDFNDRKNWSLFKEHLEIVREESKKQMTSYKQKLIDEFMKKQIDENGRTQKYEYIKKQIDEYKKTKI